MYGTTVTLKLYNSTLSHDFIVVKPKFHYNNIMNSQSGHFSIFLLLRFYMKSIFGDFRISKLSILKFLRALNFDFEKILQLLRAEIYHKLEFRAFQKAKIADF